MADNLVIVESPAKAKTIEGFLGKEFIVKSSYGHVRDLAKNDKAIDIKNNFEPTYEISEDKKHVIAELSKLVKKAKTVWLATDEDREGEAISWHLFESLNLKASSTKRIVFHEITKTAIQEAIENPRKIDKHLVDAQQARRILDRLVGFELSPILWKKIKPSLSAGRVQSVAVRLIVERERDIDLFKVDTFYKVAGFFVVNGKSFKAELSKRFDTKQEAEKFLQSCIGAKFFVKNLEVKPAKRSPAAPFTTSTLQQEASRKLGYPVAVTMRIAQSLYESGFISYMRTDSVNLSNEALNMAKSVILKNFGEKYLETHQYKTKIASAQEAHEAIRPTNLNMEVIDGNARDQKLYDLIRKRTLASQMSDAALEKTVITIESDKSEINFIGKGEVIIFDGFLKVYAESTDDENIEEEETLLPPMDIGEKLILAEAAATQRFNYPPARYTEAALVKKLEELGIGRPSTYAPTISTIQKRGYVIKEDRLGKERFYDVITLKNDKINYAKKTEIIGTEKSKLFPTDIGAVVNDFLVENFKDVLDYNFTAYVEKEFDDIAEGNLVWQKMIAEFYTPFHKNVKHTTENAERASGERFLGIDPKSGKKVSARIGRFGPMVQMKMNDEDEKPQYASLRPGQRLETITFEEALNLFKLPRNLGQYEGIDLTVSIGRFGPYVKQEGNFYSLPKTDDPYEVTLDRAIEIIEAKKKSESEKIIKIFEENKEVKVLKGRWGPYIVFGKKNIRIPKDKEPESLTYEEVIKLSESVPEFSKSKSRSFQKEPAKSKTPKTVKEKKPAAKSTNRKSNKKK